MDVGCAPIDVRGQDVTEHVLDVGPEARTPRLHQHDPTRHGFADRQTRQGVVEAIAQSPELIAIGRREWIDRIGPRRLAGRGDGTVEIAHAAPYGADAVDETRGAGVADKTFEQLQAVARLVEIELDLGEKSSGVGVPWHLLQVVATREDDLLPLAGDPMVLNAAL